MPCYSIQESRVEFLANSTDADLLEKALKKRGFTVHRSGNKLVYSKSDYYDRTNGTYDTKTGKLEYTGDLDTADLKRAYSEEVVEHVADKQDWKIEWSTNEAGNKEANVYKRS